MKKQQNQQQRRPGRIPAGPLNLQDQMEEIPSDVLGSYTGVPEDWDEVPVQDADDL